MDSEKRAQSSADTFDKLRFDLESHKNVIEDTLKSVEVDDPHLPELLLTIDDLKTQIAKAEQLVCLCC